MTIGKLLSKKNYLEFVTCESDDYVSVIVQKLADNRVGAMPVLDGGLLIGIISERDLIFRMADDGPTIFTKTVRQIMTPRPITVEKSTSIDYSLALMTKRKIGHLPVMEGSAMCGFVTISDLVKARLEIVKVEAAALREYVTSA